MGTALTIYFVTGLITCAAVTAWADATNPRAFNPAHAFMMPSILLIVILLWPVFVLFSIYEVKTVPPESEVESSKAPFDSHGLEGVVGTSDRRIRAYPHVSTVW